MIPVGSIEFVSDYLSFHHNKTVLPINVPTELLDEKFAHRKKENFFKIKYDQFNDVTNPFNDKYASIFDTIYWEVDYWITESYVLNMMLKGAKDVDFRITDYLE